jgi:glycerol-3-phosphate O-acyltransferase
VYDQIIVNESQFSQLRELIRSKKTNVVLLPTHKSYMDSILLGYIHYHFKLDYPFVCANEAFFSLALISIMIKSTNGFKLDMNNYKSDLYRTVVEAYVWALMKHNCVLEVFLEQYRSRTGKINRPSEQIFESIIKLYMRSHEKKDITFVPITINYDRVHDGESFPLELLGEAP